MILYLLHGLGGSPEDWQNLDLPGTKRLWELNLKEDFSSNAKRLALSAQNESAPVVFLGYSLGGRLALAATESLASEKLRALILVSSGFGYSSEALRVERKKNEEEWALLAERNGDFWQKWYQQGLFASFHQLPDAEKNPWLERRKRLSPTALAHQFRALGQGNHHYLFPQAKKLLAAGVPILYLAGEKDKKYAALAQEMAKIGATSKIAPNAGHILPLEAGDFLVKESNEFLKI